jgi:lipoate-protein ligase A
MRQASDLVSTEALEVISWSEPTVQQNLAVDERLAQEAGRTGRRVLRLWWGSGTIAVLGCGDKLEKALNLEECAHRGVAWLKRITGGGTVLQTPGVFNYSYTAPDFKRFDMDRVFEQGAQLIVRALAQLGVSANMRGISDVAVGDLKISGNAQARKWKSVLLHGTLLVDIDRELMDAVLKHPSKEPDYRNGRAHGDFVVTLDDLGVAAGRTEVENAFSSAAIEVFGEG